MNERQSCMYCKKQDICEKATHIENYRLKGCHEFVKRVNKLNGFSSIKILNNDQNSFYNDDNTDQPKYFNLD